MRHIDINTVTAHSPDINRSIQSDQITSFKMRNLSIWLLVACAAIVSVLC